MNTNDIYDKCIQLNNMTKFLMASIKQDKNILISDIYDFAERMNVLTNEMCEKIKQTNFT